MMTLCLTHVLEGPPIGPGAAPPELPELHLEELHGHNPRTRLGRPRQQGRSPRDLKDQDDK